MPNLYFRHMLPILLCLIVLTLPAQADDLIVGGITHSPTAHAAIGFSTKRVDRALT